MCMCTKSMLMYICMHCRFESSTLILLVVHAWMYVCIYLLTVCESTGDIGNCESTREDRRAGGAAVESAAWRGECSASEVLPTAAHYRELGHRIIPAHGGRGFDFIELGSFFAYNILQSIYLLPFAHILPILWNTYIYSWFIHLFILSQFEIHTVYNYLLFLLMSKLWFLWCRWVESPLWTGTFASTTPESSANLWEGRFPYTTRKGGIKTFELQRTQNVDSLRSWNNCPG